MANLMKHPSYMEVYAYCINDEKPKFETIDWIVKGKMYKVKCFTESLNLSDSMAVVITDNKDNELHPSPSHWSFNSERFEFLNIYLN